MAYKIKSRLWIESDGHVFLGEGRLRLLKAIGNEGSLSKAAKKINMSYKKAWNLIDSVNKSAKKPVVVSSVGGKGGGGAILTDYGKALVLAFEEINKNCWTFLDQQLENIEKL